MFRFLVFNAYVLLVFGGALLVPEMVAALPSEESSTPLPTVTPSFNSTRREPPPTVYPPTQADKGEQTYWGMCVDCHADQGQGSTDVWRASFISEFRDCWQSGCHGSDYPENSFKIPESGVPAISGPGSLAQFSNAYELQTYILEYMPLSPPGSMSIDQSWSLGAFILNLNERKLSGLTLNDVNAAAIPIHRVVDTPESEFPGVLILSCALILAAIGIRLREKQNQIGQKGSPPRLTFFHHLHPPHIPADQSRFRYTLGSGGIAVFLSLILLLTGLLEMYYYVPSPDQAAISVQTLTTLVPYGNLIRNMHYWSAQLLLIVIMVHLMRVVLTGAYAPPRRFNYLLGLGLLVSILLLDFTGYVLRWDEGIRWALVVGTNLLKTIPWMGESLYQFVIGGTEPNAATITRFFGWHVFGLTFVAGIMIVWHAFRVRRDGGITTPPLVQVQKKQLITRYVLVRRELLAMVISGVVLLILSLAINAPIKQPLSDMASMMSDSQAPWFFLWVQQLLKLGDPFLWGVLVPVLVIGVLGLLPFALPNAKANELGRWLPRGNRIAQGLTILIILVMLALTVWGAIAN